MCFKEQYGSILFLLYSLGQQWVRLLGIHVRWLPTKFLSMSFTSIFRCQKLAQGHTEKENWDFNWGHLTTKPELFPPRYAAHVLSWACESFPWNHWLKTWSLHSNLGSAIITYGMWSYLNSVWGRLLLCKMQIILFYFEHLHINSKYTFFAVKQLVIALHNLGHSPFCAGGEGHSDESGSNTFWVHLRPQNLKQMYYHGIFFN